MESPLNHHTVLQVRYTRPLLLVVGLVHKSCPYPNPDATCTRYTSTIVIMTPSSVCWIHIYYKNARCHKLTNKT